MNFYESKILLVDDEPDLLQMVGELLKKEGYVHVDLAFDCCTAKRMFGAVEYHMVLLDVMLPDGDGFTLFDEIGVSRRFLLYFYRQGMRTRRVLRVWGLARMII